MTTLITGQTWGDDVDAARAHFLSESQRPLSELRPTLAAAHAELLAACEHVSDAQAQFTPATGEGEDAWGIAEVLRHIATVEPTMAERIRLLGTGQSTETLPRGAPGHLADVETRRVAELRQALDRSYAALEGALDAIQGHEQLESVAAHRRFGELNCRGWVALHTAHLRDHARQVDRIKQLAGFPAS